MKIVTYRAANLQEALQQVREELGVDASILHVREVSKSSSASADDSASSIEVDASLDVRVQSHFEAESTEDSAAPDHSSFNAEVLAESQLSGAIVSEKPAATSKIGGATLRGSPEHMLFASMLSQGFETNAALDLLQSAVGSCTGKQAQDPATLRLSLVQQIAKQIKTSPPYHLVREDPRVMAFVGPAGAGKTTALCKVAMNLRWETTCQIGLISADFVRQGAVDQLLSFADRTSAELEVVSSPDQIQSALERLSNCDLVLMDTPGQSLREQSTEKLLGEFIEAANPDDTHLVLASNCTPQYAKRCEAHFRDLSPTSLVLTHMDECFEFASWYEFLSTSSLLVSFLIAGQDSAEGLRRAAARELAELMLTAETDCANC
ncbi:MAG: hypothetical protein AAF483_23310 [Planctomycetota bacterium]